MKKILSLICLLMCIGTLLLAAGCKKSGTSETEDKKAASAPAHESTEFNPDEPAPVPEGTPPY